jgi:hypothetical protein
MSVAPKVAVVYYSSTATVHQLAENCSAAVPLWSADLTVDAERKADTSNDSDDAGCDAR